MENKLSAKVKVYSVEHKEYFLYKYKGMFYPIPKSNIEEGSDSFDNHTEPCPYRAAMVAQKQYAPFYDKKELRIIKKKMKLETIFTF